MFYNIQIIQTNTEINIKNLYVKTNYFLTVQHNNISVKKALI